MTARDLMNEFMARNCLGGLSASAAKRGEVERAGKIWGAALASEEKQGTPLGGRERVRYDRALAGSPGRASKLQWLKGRRAISMPSLKDY